ncbi:MAG: hypothetical protein RSD49_01155 [Hafnia sp.]
MTCTRNPYAVLVCGDRDKGGREERTAVGKTGERTDRAGNKRLGRGAGIRGWLPVPTRV